MRIACSAVAFSTCVLMFTDAALGEPAPASDEPTAKEAPSGKEESVDEEAPFVDMSWFPFPVANPFKKKQMEEGAAREEDPKVAEEEGKTEGRWNDFLPLFRKQAIEKGFELPLPMGAGATFMIMDQSLRATDLRVGLGGDDPTSVNILKSGDVQANSKSANMRFDAWVLPVLNVYGVIGYTWADTDVVLTAEIDPPSLPPTVVDIPIEAQFEGLTYGLGGTLVGGYSHLFGMIDINYTWTDIPAFDNKIEKLVASGRIGLQGKVWRVGGAFWVGTMYLDNNQTIEITLPSGTGIPALDGARIEVDQDSDHSFNFIFGGLWEINRRIQLAIEGGVGERNQLMVSVGHRF